MENNIKEELEKLKNENIKNIRIIKELRKELKKMSDLCIKYDEMQENVPQEKKQKLSFEVNEKVWGFFAHKKFYLATMVDLYYGKYKIMNIEDGIIEYVEESELRKYK